MHTSYTLYSIYPTKEKYNLLLVPYYYSIISIENIDSIIVFLDALLWTNWLKIDHENKEDQLINKIESILYNDNQVMNKL